MKRMIKSAYDPYGAAIAQAQGLSVEDYQLASKLAAIFMRSSRINLPAVKMELISFKYDAEHEQITYTGDMTYNGDNEWLTISVYAHGGIKNISMTDMIVAYLKQVVDTYGKQVVVDAGLDSLL